MRTCGTYAWSLATHAHARMRACARALTGRRPPKGPREMYRRADCSSIRSPSLPVAASAETTTFRRGRGDELPRIPYAPLTAPLYSCRSGELGGRIRRREQNSHPSGENVDCQGLQRGMSGSAARSPPRSYSTASGDLHVLDAQRRDVADAGHTRDILTCMKGSLQPT